VIQCSGELKSSDSGKGISAMSDLIIINARIILDNSILDGASIYINGGIIEKITADVPCTCNSTGTVDAKNMFLSPGFIDMHVHGVKGRSTESAGMIAEMSELLPRYGVTGFLPSIVPKNSKEEDLDLIKTISTLRPTGTQIFGIMLEGHFLSLTGALKRLSDEEDNLQRVKDIIKYAKPYKAIFSISPEFENIDELLPIMTENGVPAFITHTKATWQQTLRAIDMGAVHATHFLNVFPYAGDKEPGVRSCGAVEAIYSRPDASVDFILDGVHVEPLAVKMAVVCKGIDKVSLVSDANIHAGMPPGQYKGLGDIDVMVEYDGGPARCGPRSHAPGGLAGSGLTMNKALKNAVEMVGLSIADAVKTVSANPARVLKLDNKKGHIVPGYDADIVLFDDRFDVGGCWVKGKRCY
jgi:N-acetylglucosamine-6-phosphate deacetylase